MKSLASAISIGTGAAVGREGPIIQIGASLGSSLGQFVHMAPWQRITLVAAGAGAGIAATFNTPIGGVMFAIELMLPEFCARTFLPVALATGTATFIGRIFLGLQPAFAVPAALLNSDKPASLTALLLYALLGALMGLAATAFITGLSLAEDIFESIENGYLRHAVGMLMIGVLMYALLLTAGQYYVDGVGYATIQAILSGGLIVPGCWCCCSSPSCARPRSASAPAPRAASSRRRCSWARRIGGAFGAAISAIHPIDGLGVTTCAMIGMAAMVGGGTGAAMTAVTMIFEMTRDYDLVMPIIVAVALAIGVRRLFSQENIYTVKLVGRQHFVPKALHANMFLVRRAGEVMERDVTLLPKDTPAGDFLRQVGHEGRMKHIVVTDGDRIVGVLRVNTALRRGLEDVEQRLHCRRDRAAQLHGGARGGHRVRRGHAHEAA